MVLVDCPLVRGIERGEKATILVDHVNILDIA
jgi:hypothetical protein